ncbi:hypothetical protein [Actinomadura sp. NEAU-AAG7]|uniref:hypothetical protein n=1 Tax=Actinomadura sp. NEAU-AAG7 TaxID=2839640 RepID=UPI001BE3ED9D|nr:hypothetical protein [Actinomadura sp. NEAU-AAG7]MBT2213452.1 hypothetical protein [Actinomadura sp. NEAU-AAG7]
MALIVGVLFVGSLLFSVGYTRHVSQEADRRWCALLESLDAPWTPATTERGKEIQRQVHTLRRDLGCTSE